MLLDVHLSGNFLGATPDGRVVVVSAGTGAYAWVSGTPERTVYLGPQRDVRLVAVSPDGRWAATVTYSDSPTGDVGVNVWEVETGKRVAVLAARTRAGRSSVPTADRSSS